MVPPSAAYWAMPAGLAAGLAGRRLSTPVVVTCDSGEFVSVPEASYGLQRQVRSRLAVAAAVRLAHAVTVCTRYQHKRASALGVRAGESYVDVGTLHGYREATQLLERRRQAAAAALTSVTIG